MILLAFCACFSMQMRAQWGYGVKAGGVYSKQSVGYEMDIDSKWGLAAGGIVTYSLSDHFDLQGELYYANRGYKITIYTDMGAEKAHDWVFSYHYINMPLLLKCFPTGKGFYLLAGPEQEYLADMKNTIKNWKPEEPVDDTEWKEGHTRWGCSLVGGIGAIMNNGIFVDLRYNYGLTSALKDWKSKNRSLELSVGYMF